MGGTTRWLLGVFVVAAVLATSGVARGDQEVGLGDGAWSWFADPRAVTYTGQHTRTYVGRLSQAGDVAVESYDHATRARTTGVVRTAFQRDDHANPVILVRPDGRLTVFYSGHNGSAMYYRVSTNPEDVTSWGPETTVPVNSAVAPGGTSRGYTYPNPIRLSGESRTYLFWRGADYQPTFSTLPDNGTTWTPAQGLISVPSQRPYVKYASNGTDAIDVAFTNAHPRESGDVNIYYARVRGGKVERADSTQLASLGTPITPSQADKVFDGPAGENAWVHDVARDANGRPVIVFASFPGTGDHRYHYARWTGSAWDVHQITPAGGSISPNTIEEQYSGGITLDHEDPSHVYLSRQVGSTWEVESWVTSDGGTNWTSQPITSGSADMNVRPISPRGLIPFDSGLTTIWLRGTYGTYRTYGTSLAAQWRVPPVPQPPAPESANGSPPAQAAKVSPTTPGAAADRSAPRLGRLALSRRTFKSRTGLALTLSEASKVTLTVERVRIRGRSKRYAKVRGSKVVAGRRGRTRLTFRGTFAGRRLTPGRYRLTARALDGAGNASRPQRVGFVISR